ncbi:MAG: hypothetical protein DMF79_18250, partial [Acidobacteria bacterium]
MDAYVPALKDVMRARRPFCLVCLALVWPAVPSAQDNPPDLREQWRQLARLSALVATATVEEAGIMVIRPEKKVVRMTQRADGQRIVHLPR